ncbi:squalene-hopene cyclase [Catenulispora acidiphila DSM 44928]|uniref:Squalene-hopene cyclase n=1 Tax=Catenulispora acidiphila (strain DSM 44928 / JCM 14897 / NBRC 102108 / NRRL B-24433 / ID139908) TaxID=479433 RepID=C7Q017_CATAD|nr:squalene--hopene cyclase [Catenulispora acidiphila]ACU75510.1 squalene-hopene cyclase [Catenulispora acidiphila DSM 44928]
MTDVIDKAVAATGPADPSQGAAATLQAAADHLLGLQDDAGWWKGELETNVTMDAEDLLLRQFLGIRTEEVTREAGDWIRSQQRADGTWANFFDGPADLSTTIEAYTALRMAGDAKDAEHMRAARTYILDSGGIEASRVFTRIWLALFGEWQWSDLPVMPPELIYLPKWFPLNVYDWACWARQTVVPLTIVNALRPVRPLGFDLKELRTGRRAPAQRGLFSTLDRALHVYERKPLRSVRDAALRRSADWIIARQEADGSWGGIQPPWVYSLMALNLLGYGVDHPVMRKGIEGLDRFTIRDERGRRLEACQSPVWDTVLAMTALRDAELPENHPALVKAADWVLGEEITNPGDWSVRRPRVAPGGWAFEFDNDGYPDVDDTAEVVLALNRVAHPDAPAAIRRGVDWLEGMACKDGGYGAFDADNTRTLALKLPFCDFGAVIDPPTADVTAHTLEAYAALGLANSRASQRALEWLVKAQERDGSWFGRWGANHVYGTGAVVPAMVAVGVDPEDEMIRRAVRWLEEHQNDDGGWGEDLRSYRDKSWIGRGVSTASQTAWALLALLAAGEERGTAVEQGVRFLIRTQRADGTWDEDHYTGTGFPGDFYLNYHLYRLVFPISALGRYVRAVGAAGDGGDAGHAGHAGTVS